MSKKEPIDEEIGFFSFVCRDFKRNKARTVLFLIEAAAFTTLTIICLNRLEIKGLLKVVTILCA
jgi:hypothetical protein